MRVLFGFSALTMALHLYNTLSGKVEEFRPLEDNEVRMYACGPTVYDYGHIGNFRTFIAVDILRRFLRQSGYKIRHVMNITDVDDKIIRNSASDGVSVKQYTAKYEKAFLEDAAALNIEQPMLARATDHIPEMAEFIAALAEKRIRLPHRRRVLLFQDCQISRITGSFRRKISPEWKMARASMWMNTKKTARATSHYGKRRSRARLRGIRAIGPGRPGWHIECSVMAMEELGETFDLHAGGEDLIFPHHENEIAQSESLSGKPFAHFWFHVRFLLVEGEKMSKSTGNFFTVA